MKLLISILFMTTAATAQARTPIRYVQSSLKAQFIEAHSPLADYDIETAHISYDALEKTLTLTIEPTMPLCDIDMVCLAVMPTPVVIEMEEAFATSGACGETIYTASIDETAHDGLLETLTLTDNSQIVCDGLQPIARYEVTYKTFNPWTQEESLAKFISPQPTNYQTTDKSILPVQPKVQLMGKSILPVEPEVQTMNKTIQPVPPVEM